MIALPRTTMHRRARLLVLVFAQLCAFSHPAFADADPNARHHYERALAELQAGKLREARQSFEEAYRLSPHFIVLYNLGRVSFDLGELDTARGYFERYLEQGGHRVAPEDRERVEALIARTRVEPTRPLNDASAARPEPAPSLHGPAPLPQSTPSPSPAPLARPARVTAPPAATGSNFRQRLARERQTTLAVSLGVTGAVMGAAGTAVLVWNDRRFADYQAERAAIGNPPPETLRSQEELDQALSYERARAENQEDLESVRDFDAVGWTVAGVGTALVATAVVLYLTRPSEGTLSVGLGRAELGFRF
jgi:tetratricopeptide (TPR) repeat protein